MAKYIYKEIDYDYDYDYVWGIKQLINNNLR